MYKPGWIESLFPKFTVLPLYNPAWCANL